MRLAKRFVITPKVRLQANFNIYNVFNGSASSVLNTNYGSLWLQPSLLQDGRMVQFSASLILAGLPHEVKSPSVGTVFKNVLRSILCEIIL